MKDVLFTATRILIFLVLLGKVLNWILDFSDETNSILDILMFTLIGIAYIVMGWVWGNKVTKIVATTCGVFLIAMNFFNNTPLLNLIGIVCILTPMLIARFYKKADGKMNMPRAE
jgi:hypothetical protein